MTEPSAVIQRIAMISVRPRSATYLCLYDDSYTGFYTVFTRGVSTTHLPVLCSLLSPSAIILHYFFIWLSGSSFIPICAGVAGMEVFMKLKKQFEDFHDSIRVGRGNISNDLIEKRSTLQSTFEDKFPDICKDDGIIINKSDMRFIDQGSYKIGTIIKSPSDGSIDRDVAV